MSYSVKEIYLTIQGEGGQTGLPAVFLRFAGCNLWNGLASGRASAVCKFCDTDFIGTDGPGGGKFTDALALAKAVNAAWPSGKGIRNSAAKWVVCTGGEPLLQLDAALISALHAQGFKIAVESNGTIKTPDGIDWLCISPKAGAPLVQTSGHELKLVFPQNENSPEEFAHLDFDLFSLQPRDGTAEGQSEANAKNLKAALDYTLSNPQWRLSIQTHKLIGIP